MKRTSLSIFCTNFRIVPRTSTPKGIINNLVAKGLLILGKQWVLGMLMRNIIKEITLTQIIGDVPNAASIFDQQPIEL